MGEFKNAIPHLDCERCRQQAEPLGLTEEIVTFARGKVAEWNASFCTATGFLEGAGVNVRLTEYRFTAAATQLKRWLDREHTAARPLIFIGGAHTGHEVLSLQKNLEKLLSSVAVLATPSEITGEYASCQLWTHHFWIDSSTMGDAVGGFWNVSHCTRAPLSLTIYTNLQPRE